MKKSRIQGDGCYGRLIFPVDIDIDRSLKLKDVSSILPWYSEVSVSKTVEIVNYMKDQADSGAQIFYDIYSEEEKEADPDKRDTGLFFFRGQEGAKTAITNAEIEVFRGLFHGFGLGEGTVAEGWIDHAVAFWKENMR